MKIREVKISNLMSFPYIENLDDFIWMDFEKPENSLDMNILIWANGSWKSNFIEIINQFCRNLIFDYTFNQSILEEKNEPEYKNAIKLISKNAYKLSKHTKFQDKPSRVEVVLEFFDADFENIWFVCKNTKKINYIIGKYSELNYRFPHFNLNTIKKEIKKIRLKAEFDEKKQCFIIDRSTLTPMEFFSLVCVQERELIYICTNIFNKREKKKNEGLWWPLKNTFTILSSQRDLVEWKYLNEFQDFDEYIFRKSEEINPNLEWYYKCLQKIRDIIKRDDQIENEEGLSIWQNTWENRLQQSTFWKSLTNLIEKFIHKSLTIDYIQWWINLLLKNPDWEPCYFDDLWAWQQSLLLIIFTLLWNDSWSLMNLNFISTHNYKKNSPCYLIKLAKKTEHNSSYQHIQHYL